VLAASTQLQGVACRCQISGVSGVPLVLSPIWQENSKDRSIALRGVRWVATPLRDAQQRLLQEPEDPDTLWAFQAMNGSDPIPKTLKPRPKEASIK